MDSVVTNSTFSKQYVEVLFKYYDEQIHKIQKILYIILRSNFRRLAFHFKSML